MTSNRRGFTLVELLVVISMIAIILASFVTSIRGAQERVRIQKAQSEVKSIAQAVLGYENIAKGYVLPSHPTPIDIDKSSCGFLFGSGTDQAGTQLPVLLLAALSAGGKMIDPWGQPYRLKIDKNSVKMTFTGGESDNLSTRYVLPNARSLGVEDRR